MKQYLLVCDEEMKMGLEQALKVQFLEVSGMNLKENNQVQVLVTPANTVETECEPS